MDKMSGDILARLDAEFAGSVWDVLPGLHATRKGPAGSYPTATAAVLALEAAGYELTGRGVPTPPLGGTYDLRSVLRFQFAGAGNELEGMVTVARRDDRDGR
jgi:hypothetical protein